MEDGKLTITKTKTFAYRLRLTAYFMNTHFTIEDCTLIDVTTFTDERGFLSVLENGQPFVTKRVFWMHHIAAGAERGAHAMVLI